MAEQVIIEFVANADQLQPAVDNLNKITGADQKLEQQVNRTATAFTQQMSKQTDSSKVAKLSVDQLSKSVQDLNKNVINDSAAKQLKKFGDEAGQVTSKATRLTTELRNLKQQLAVMESSGQAGTRAFEQMAVKAGKLQDQIGDTAQRIRILASDTKNLDAALSLASGLAGGFAVAQGAAALFGSENEDLQKALLKVQGALAVLNGLQAVSATINKDSAASVVIFGGAWKAVTTFINESTFATKAFRIALVGTGIGAFVIAIGFLVEKFLEMRDASNQAASEVFKFTEQRKKAFENVSGEIGKAQELVLTYKNVSLSTKERKEALEELQNLYPNYFGNLDFEKSSVDEVTAAYERLTDALIIKGQIEEKISELVSLKDQIDELKKSIELYGSSQTEAYKSGSLAINPQVAQLGLLEALYGTMTQSITDLQIQQQALGGSTDKATHASKDHTKAIKEEKDELELLVDAAIKANDQLDKAEAGERKRLQDEFDASMQQLEDLVDAEFAAQDKITDKKREERERQLENDQKFIAASIGLINTLFQFSLSNIDNELASLEDQHNKKTISDKEYARKKAQLERRQAIAEKEQAAFNIAINIAEAVTKALTAGPVIGQVLAAITAAAGAIQLAAVLSKPLPALPAFAKGTEMVTGGTAGKDSVLSLLMPGERVVDAATNSKLMGIPNAQLPALVGMALPYVSDDTMTMMERGHNGFAIDYDELGKSVAKHMRNNERVSINIDERGFEKRLMEGMNRRKSIDDYFSWNG